MRPMTKTALPRVARTLGILFGVLAFSATAIIWEPHSAVVKARIFEAGCLIIAFLLIWYSKALTDK